MSFGHCFALAKPNSFPDFRRKLCAQLGESKQKEENMKKLLGLLLVVGSCMTAQAQTTIGSNSVAPATEEMSKLAIYDALLTEGDTITLTAQEDIIVALNNDRRYLSKPLILFMKQVARFDRFIAKGTKITFVIKQDPYYQQEDLINNLYPIDPSSQIERLVIDVHGRNRTKLTFNYVGSLINGGQMFKVTEFKSKILGYSIPIK